MENAELTEVLRFALGLAGLWLTFGCIAETLDEYQFLRRERPGETERLIVAFGWVRAAFGRLLTSSLLATSGWLLMTLGPGINSETPQGVVMRWGWVLLGAYLVTQAMLAKRDRAKIRRARQDEAGKPATNEGTP